MARCGFAPTAQRRATWALPRRRSRSDDGFVDTGDMVELEEGRYYFRGRKGGIINVGGLKVYPEEVESVLNADPRVRMSRVSGPPQSDHRRLGRRRGGAERNRQADAEPTRMDLKTTC